MGWQSAYSTKVKRKNSLKSKHCWFHSDLNSLRQNENSWDCNELIDATLSNPLQIQRFSYKVPIIFNTRQDLPTWNEHNSIKPDFNYHVTSWKNMLQVPGVMHKMFFFSKYGIDSWSWRQLACKTICPTCIKKPHQYSTSARSGQFKYHLQRWSLTGTWCILKCSNIGSSCVYGNWDS